MAVVILVMILFIQNRLAAARKWYVGFSSYWNHLSDPVHKGDLAKNQKRMRKTLHPLARTLNQLPAEYCYFFFSSEFLRIQVARPYIQTQTFFTLYDLYQSMKILKRTGLDYWPKSTLENIFRINTTCPR